MKYKNTILSVSCVTMIITIVSCFLFGAKDKPIVTNANSSYTLTLNSYSGNQYQTYTTSSGNPLEFIFFNCVSTDKGMLLVQESSSIGNNTQINKIKTITINTVSFDDILIDVTIYKNGNSLYNESVLTNIPYDVKEGFYDNDGFSVAFEPGTPSDTLVISVAIEYSCH